MIKNNQNKYIKPYKARNKMLKMETLPVTPTQAHINQHPHSGPTQTQITDDVGYVNVGVYTASGALPVQDALVTLYHTYNGGEEHVLYHLTTDSSGRVPTMEVPIYYSGVGRRTEYDYSIYNLRVQSIGYYTHNVLDLQIFPNITSNIRVNLIPAPAGVPEDSNERTTVIPPRPDIEPFS